MPQTRPAQTPIRTRRPRKHHPSTTPVDSARRAPGQRGIVDYFTALYGNDTARFGETMQHLGFEVKDEANGYLRNDIDDLYIPILELGWDRTRFAVEQTYETLPPFP